MSKFEVEITSPPDRENLVAEIWFGQTLFAEINQVNGFLEIEFYNALDGNSKSFQYDEFIQVVEEAKNKLVGK